LPPLSSAEDEPNAERIETYSRDFIIETLQKKIDPYRFEHLTAARLRAMGCRDPETPGDGRDLPPRARPARTTRRWPASASTPAWFSTQSAASASSGGRPVCETFSPPASGAGRSLREEVLYHRHG
jgi:hypothetical protein